jgi:hypothetical protein
MYSFVRPITSALLLGVTSLFSISLARAVTPGVPEVAAEFETVVKQIAPEGRTQKRVWRMFRAASEIETGEVGSPDGEVWRKEGENEVYYSRLFHPERRVVEYAPRDLLLARIPTDWERVLYVVSPELLAKLERGAVAAVGSYSGTSYSGQVGARAVEVIWSEEWQLPLKLTTTEASVKTEVVLREIHTLEKSPWEQLGKRGYFVVEFIDLGDCEQDPVMRRVMARMGKVHNCGAICATGGHNAATQGGAGLAPTRAGR